jgi:hypothetical protein
MPRVTRRFVGVPHTPEQAVDHRVPAGLGYTTPGHFFYGDDHHGELLRGYGSDPCRNDFLTTEP